MPVSRYSVSRSSSPISKWETVPNWCDLCCEPVNAREQHIGKREHICMETALQAAVAYPRRWSAPEVWEGAELFRHHYTRRPRGQPRQLSAHMRRMLEAGLHVPAPDSPLNMFYEAFDRDEPMARREEIIVLLLHLQACGVLHLTPANLADAALHGSAVLHKELMPLLLRVYPDAEVRSFSAMLALSHSAWAAEALFYFAGLQALLTPELIRAFSGKSSKALMSSLEGGDDGAEGGGEGPQTDAVDGSGDGGDEAGGVSMYLRCITPRAVLGMLRWSSEPEKMQVPPAILADEKRYGHYTTLAARACRLLLSELAFLRVSEYVVRAESLMRAELTEEAERHQSRSQRSVDGVQQRGEQRSTLTPTQVRLIYTQRSIPHLSNEGSVGLNGGSSLSAANVLGTSTADNAIRMLEGRRALRVKRKHQSSGTATSSKPLARTVLFR